jgi:hypothetical protein
MGTGFGTGFAAPWSFVLQVLPSQQLFTMLRVALYHAEGLPRPLCSASVDAPPPLSQHTPQQGMGTGFGTGSAAPWSGDRSIKEVAGLFSDTHSSLDIGTMGPEEQQQLVEAAAQVGGWGGWGEG